MNSSKICIFFCFLIMTSCCIIDPCYCENDDFFSNDCEDIPEIFFDPPDWIIGTWKNENSNQEIQSFTFTYDNILLTDVQNNIMSLSFYTTSVIEDRNDDNVYEFTLYSIPEIPHFTYKFVYISDSMIKYSDSGGAEFEFVKD